MKLFIPGIYRHWSGTQVVCIAKTGDGCYIINRVMAGSGTWEVTSVEDFEGTNSKGEQRYSLVIPFEVTNYKEPDDV